MTAATHDRIGGTAYHHRAYGDRPEYTPSTEHSDMRTEVSTQLFRDIQTYQMLRITVRGLCPSSGIVNTRKHNVSETGSVGPVIEVSSF
jgi:hypothetical protein